MHKLVTGLLAVLVLFLAAAYSRQRQQRDALERKLAALESRPRPAPPALPEPLATADPVPPPTPAPQTSVPAAAAPKASAPVVEGAKNFLTHALTDAHDALANLTIWTKTTLTDDELGLTKDQKAAIDELKRVRDLRTKGRKEEIQAIEDQTEAAIRQVLTPEQLAKYDGQTKQLDVVAGTVDPQADPSNRGFLGVSGTDAEGGGARLAQVFEKSAAAETGLKADDVILEFNGEKVADYTDLAKKIQANSAGASVVLRVRRGDADFVQVVTLGTRK